MSIGSNSSNALGCRDFSDYRRYSLVFFLFQKCAARVGLHTVGFIMRGTFGCVLAAVMLMQDGST